MRLKLRRPKKSQLEKETTQLTNLLYPEEFHLGNLAISGRAISVFKILYHSRSCQS